LWHCSEYMVLSTGVHKRNVGTANIVIQNVLGALVKDTEFGTVKEQTSLERK
jgi:hypothetical protein